MARILKTEYLEPSPSQHSHSSLSWDKTPCSGHGLDELRAIAGGREARGGWWWLGSGSGDERKTSRLDRWGYLELKGLGVGGEGDRGIKEESRCLAG